METTENQNNIKNDTKSQSDIGDDYSKGYRNGLYAVDKESYRKFLENYIRFDTLNEIIENKRDEKQDLEDKLVALHSQKSDYYERFQMHKNNLEMKEMRMERMYNTLNVLEDEKTRYEAEKENVREEYSLVAGIIFLVAGAIFMAGDLIISHEIVAYALNIRNKTEAWLFAGGLAALSILFKPAYDRLFEKPFKNNTEKTHKSYLWLKGTVVSFALLTLFVLGWFRFEAYRINEQKSQINRVISSLQSEDMKPEVLKKVEELLSQQQSLGMQLVNSLWGLFSFVLTGILFAVSGAICLGIGLPILLYYWRRWLQLPMRIRLLKWRRQRIVRKLEKDEQILAGEKTHREICDFEFKKQDGLVIYESRINELKQEITTLIEERMQAEINARISLYHDGYGNGFALQDDGHMKGGFPVDEKALNSDILSEKENRNFVIKEFNRNKPRNRPHLALRQFISDGFNKND